MAQDVIDSLPGGRQVMKAISSGDISVQQLRSLPAQHLYMAIQALGLESVPEVLLDITTAQYQLLLDFEFWSKDSFQEEHFFEWLYAIDEDDSFDQFEKLLLSMDIELLALMIARRVRAVVHEEATEQSPGVGWYTPDNGTTWVLIDIEDPRRHRVLGKLLAYLVQRSPETFYQLVLSVGAATPIEIEEECYQTQRRRLADQGIPDHEDGWRVHVALAESVAESRIAAYLEEYQPAVEVSTEVVAPISTGFQAFDSFLASLSDRESIEVELAGLLNAAVVYFGVDFSDEPRMERIANQVRGAINVGIERARELTSAPNEVLHGALGVRGLYQLGLGLLYALRSQAGRKDLDPETPNPSLDRVCELAKEAFPRWPMFLAGLSEYSQDSTAQVFTTVDEIRRVERYLNES